MASQSLEGAILDQKAQIKIDAEEKVNGVNGHPSPKCILPDTPADTTDGISDTMNGHSDPKPETSGDINPRSPHSSAGDMEVDKPDAPAPEPTEDAEMPDAPNGADDAKLSESAENAASAGSNSEVDMVDVPRSQSQVSHHEPTSPAEPPESTQNTSGLSDEPLQSPKDIDLHPASMSELALTGSLDAPAIADGLKSPAKVAREREEDVVDGEPALKRARTESQKPSEPERTSPEMAPTEPTTAEVTTGGETVAKAPATEDHKYYHIDWSQWEEERDSRPMSAHMVANVKRFLSNTKKSKNSEAFRLPVEQLWPGLWDNYRRAISHPVDLTTMEKKVKAGQYKTLGEFKEEVKLLFQNCWTFNGLSLLPLCDQAYGITTRLLQQIKDTPNEPKGQPKPIKPPVAHHREPRAAAPKPRRESKAAPAPSPTVAKNEESPTFAVGPSGVPTIRRDSTKLDDNRPKRPIHPPKSKDLDYANKGSKKKLGVEMKFYDHILSEMRHYRNRDIASAFLQPVDPVALAIPTYFQVIKKPMDLSTIQDKLDSGQYKKGKDLEADMTLMFKNCYKFNPPGHAVHEAGLSLEKLFKNLLSEKEAWITKHTPAPAPTPAPAKQSRTAHESEPEESDEEEQAEEANLEAKIKALTTRLIDENAKLNKEIAKNNPDENAIVVHNAIISGLQSQIIEAKKQGSQTKKPKPKPKKPAKASSSGHKKSDSNAARATASKKGSGGGTKKSGPQRRGKPTELERDIVTEGIMLLDEDNLATAIKIIKADTNETENDSGELELDISALSPDALWKLFDIINKSQPHLLIERQHHQAALEAEPEPVGEPEPAPISKAAKPRKNKPMGKAEQERKIEQLKSLKAQFQRQGSGSQEPQPIPSIEQPDAEDLPEGESSEEEEEEDSEEE